VENGGMILLLSCMGALTAVQDAEGMYDVTTFGARGGGLRYDTESIQKAIDRAAHAGGGIVRIPKGRFLSRRLRLRSGVTLHLAEGAELLGPPSPEEYQGLHHLIYALDAQDIALTGPGLIDGRAADDAANAFWDVGPGRRMTYPKKEATREASLVFLSFKNCRNVRLEGVRVIHSPGWTVLLENCSNVRVRNVEIRNSVFGPNTDGFDLVNSRDVTLSDCRISTCDDAVVLKTDRPDGLCEEITVRGCEMMTPSYGFKIGTETAGTVRRIRCLDSTIAAPDARGLRGAVALCSVDGAQVSDVVVSGVSVEGARAALFLRLGNRGRGQADPKPGSLKDILIENVKARRPAASDWSSALVGLPGHRIQNVVLRDVEIHVRGGGAAPAAPREIEERPEAYPDAQMFGELPSHGFFVRHVERLRMANVRVICAKPEERPVLVGEDVGSLSLESLVSDPKLPRDPAKPSLRAAFRGAMEAPAIRELEKDGVWTLTTPAEGR
jgi:hypothetical protein